MKANKILFGGIAGGITFFLLGWLVYGVLLMEYTSENYNQCSSRPMEEMVWWSMILSNMAYGFLIAVVFSWTNRSGILAGATVGAIVGFLLSISIDLNFYAMTTMFSGFAPVVVDILVSTTMSAVLGIVVAWVMGMVKK